MSKTLYFLLLPALLFPFTLHSTDIYTSSHGEVRIHANLNSHIIPGDAKLGSTVLVVSAPIEQENIHVVTPCEHKESVLYKEAKGENKMMYVIHVVFPVSCDSTDISLGDKENIFTDSTFSLPMEPFWRMENSLINTDSAHLLEIMREQPISATVGTGTTIVEKLQYLQTLYKNIDITLESGTARDILQAREDAKYISPVAGYGLPSKNNLIPGADR